MWSVEQPDKGPDTPAADQSPRKRVSAASRRPSWRSLLIGLGIALVMVSLMATTYVWANHALVAHNLPWGQVGSSPLTTTVGKSISLDVHQYASESDLETAANKAQVYGGFVASTNTVVTVEAASLWAPG